MEREQSSSLTDRFRAWSMHLTDFREEDVATLDGLIKRGALGQAMPTVVAEFEKRFAEFCGVTYGLSFCNGTSAIHAALRALDVRAGDEVLIADYGFHGMAAAILALGARIVPCDVDPVSLSFAPTEIQRATTLATKAILLHNPWGLPADLAAIRDIADRAGIPVIADASHAHGALYDGKPLANFADITCYSLGLRKLISGGELGCAVTSSAELYDRMLIYSHVNRVPNGLVANSWKGNAVGLKARPHPCAAALALQQLRRFPEKLTQLKVTCVELEKRFAKLGFFCQTASWPVERVYWRLVFRADETRWPKVTTAAFERVMLETGIPVEPNPYWPTLQYQKIFEWPEYVHLVRRRNCPQAGLVGPKLITMLAPVFLEKRLIDEIFEDLTNKLNQLLL